MIKAELAALTEERDQLLEILQGLREEKNQMKSELEEKDDLLMSFRNDLHSTGSVVAHLQTERSTQELSNMAELERFREAVTALTDEKDQIRDENQQLRTELEERNERIVQLKDELQSTISERDDLLCTRSQGDHENAAVEMIKAELAALTEERDQLLEILQGLREEKYQMKSELEEKDDLLMSLRNELQSTGSEEDHLQTERSTQELSNMAELERFRETVTALTDEKDQIRDENMQLRTELEERNEKILLLREELQSVITERDDLLCIRTQESTSLEIIKAEVAALNEEREQLLNKLQCLREEENLLKNNLLAKDDVIIQLREELQSVNVQNNLLLTEKNQEVTKLEQTEAELSSVTQERDQVLDVLQGLREETNLLKRDLEEKDGKVLQLMDEIQHINTENEHLLAKSEKCNLDNAAELEKLQVNIISVTEERDQLLEVLQGMREEKMQLKEDLEKKETLIQQLKDLEKLRTISTPESSTNVSEAGDRIQELLQGVRELIQVQGELKQQKNQDAEPAGPSDSREAELQQLQTLKDEVDALRNERTVLRTDLQEAAEMSKTYQNLLHSTKEELKQLQKENMELMTQSREKEAQLQQKLNQLNEDLLRLKNQLATQKTAETQVLNTELQDLQTRVTCAEEEKRGLQEMLHCVREEGVKLSTDLKQKDEMILRLTEELESLSGIKDQLLNEKTNADQLQEVFNDVREERETLRKELEKKMEELGNIEEKVQRLEKQNADLQSEVSSLNQSLNEMNEHPSSSEAQRLKVLSEIETCNEKLKAAFLKLQTIIDRPAPKDCLTECDNKEWSLVAQLLPLVSKCQRKVYLSLALKTTQLKDTLIKNSVTLKGLAERHKSHFIAQVQHDVAFYEERRLLDVLIHRARAPSQSVQSLHEDFQQIWDQRLVELLEKRKHYLKDLYSVLEFMEDAVAKHAVTLSEEHQARLRAHEQYRTLTRTSDSAAVIQMFEQELARRTALVDRQRIFRHCMLDKYDSAECALKCLEEESEQNLKEARSENLTLLPAQNGDLPKTEAVLLQDKQSLTLQLHQAQKQLGVIQKKMEELKTQLDMSNQKHVLKLHDLTSDLNQKENLILNLKTKLKEAEALAKVKLPPSAAEMEAMKDKLVKMELDHIAVTTGHEKEISQLSSMLEHRDEVIYKLKENLRKTKQEEEGSFMESKESQSKAGTQTSKTLVCLKEKRIEELEQKNTHYESLVNKQQDEITKWKHRAYKLRESKKEAPRSPRTPTKRHPPLTETEVNSPKKVFLDSPKSKFFDVRAGTESMTLGCPKQFFDNSSLGTMPDAGSSAAVSSGESNADSWWNIPNSSPRKANANMGANQCPTQ